jgi:UDPglucose--hexose-1-phosphate uridylyltransferase
VFLLADRSMPTDDPSRDPHVHHHALAARTVVVAPRRADRPHDLTGEPASRRAAACPFCAGNESLTPPAILQVPVDRGTAWHARIIPNRYPIVEPLDGPPSARDGRPAHGVHDVDIESPAHVGSILEAEPLHWRDAWRLVRARLAMLADRGDIAWATVFKNAGSRAGASLQHLHSQLIGLDFVPPQMQAEVAAAMGTADPFGELMSWAATAGCVVATAADLVALVPPAPRQPFETWILPRSAEAFLHETSDARLEALADLTRDVVGRIDRVVAGVDFNWWLHQAPYGRHAAPVIDRWHWHLEILPRLANIAGFELGTGCHISTLGAEAAARLLRQAC